MPFTDNSPIGLSTNEFVDNNELFSKQDALAKARDEKLAALQAYAAANAQKKAIYDATVPGRMGLDPEGIIGAPVNALAGFVSSATQVGGAIASIPNMIGAIHNQSYLDPLDYEAAAQQRKGIATPEEIARLNTPREMLGGLRSKTPQQMLEDVDSNAWWVRNINQAGDYRSLQDQTGIERIMTEMKPSFDSNFAQMEKGLEDVGNNNGTGQGLWNIASGAAGILGNLAAKGITEPNAVVQLISQNAAQFAMGGYGVAGKVMLAAFTSGYAADYYSRALKQYQDTHNGDLPDENTYGEFRIKALSLGVAEFVGDSVVGSAAKLHKLSGAAAKVSAAAIAAVEAPAKNLLTRTALASLRTAGTSLKTGLSEAATEGYQTAVENNLEGKSSTPYDIFQGAAMGFLAGGGVHAGSHAIGEMTGTTEAKTAARRVEIGEQQRLQAAVAAADPTVYMDESQPYYSPEKALVVASLVTSANSTATPDQKTAAADLAESIITKMEARRDSLDSSLKTDRGHQDQVDVVTLALKDTREKLKGAVEAKLTKADITALKEREKNTITFLKNANSKGLKADRAELAQITDSLTKFAALSQSINKATLANTNSSAGLSFSSSTPATAATSTADTPGTPVVPAVGTPITPLVSATVPSVQPIAGDTTTGAPISSTTPATAIDPWEETRVKQARMASLETEYATKQDALYQIPENTPAHTAATAELNGIADELQGLVNENLQDPPEVVAQKEEAHNVMLDRIEHIIAAIKRGDSPIPLRTQLGPKLLGAARYYVIQNMQRLAPTGFSYIVNGAGTELIKTVDASHVAETTSPVSEPTTDSSDVVVDTRLKELATEYANAADAQGKAKAEAASHALVDRVITSSMGNPEGLDAQLLAELADDPAILMTPTQRDYIRKFSAERLLHNFNQNVESVSASVRKGDKGNNDRGGEYYDTAITMALSKPNVPLTQRIAKATQLLAGLTKFRDNAVSKRDAAITANNKNPNDAIGRKLGYYIRRGQDGVWYVVEHTKEGGLTKREDGDILIGTMSGKFIGTLRLDADYLSVLHDKLEALVAHKANSTQPTITPTVAAPAPAVAAPIVTPVESTAQPKDKTTFPVSEESKTIYGKLGNKTVSGNVVINKVYQLAGVAYAKSIGAIFSLRVDNSNKHFGNPFSSVTSEIAKGLVGTKSTKESVQRYIDWVLAESTVYNPEQHAWIRQQLKSGNLKGKQIVYYKELGEPSHATALDYLINKYDWGTGASTKPVTTPKADLILPIGTSGSGKSTWIKSVNSEGDYTVISLDDLRVELTGDVDNKTSDEAVYAEATILTDKLSDRERSFNVGEREVAAHLTKNGYVEEGNTGVWKPKVETPDTTPPVEEIVTPPKAFELNEGQKNAFTKIMEFINDSRQTFSLVGPAGTGKTTIVNTIVAALKKAGSIYGEVILTSPTHRANTVTRSKNPDETVVTLHKLLGLSPSIDLDNLTAEDAKFAQRQIPEDKDPFPKKGLVIVDESSMMNKELYNFLMIKLAQYPQVKILFLGDLAQLRPIVKDTKDANGNIVKAISTDSPALLDTKNQAVLDEVMRAKNPELLDESVYVRNGVRFSNTNNMTESNGVSFSNSFNEFTDALVTMFKSKDFLNNRLLVRAVAYTNDRVKEINKKVRAALFGSKAAGYIPGDLIMGYKTYLDKEDPLSMLIANGVDYLVLAVGEIRTEVQKGTNKYGMNLPDVSLLVQDLAIKDIYGVDGVSTITVVLPSNTPDKISTLSSSLR